MDKTVEWADQGRDPRVAPDPAFPNGITVNVAEGADKTCTVDIPYPARRCGVWIVRCSTCGYSAGLTAAGRPDDPRRLVIPCHGHKLQPRGLTKVLTQPGKTPWVP